MRLLHTKRRFSQAPTPFDCTQQAINLNKPNEMSCLMTCKKIVQRYHGRICATSRRRVHP
jgi:hypothetical protein